MGGIGRRPGYYILFYNPQINLSLTVRRLSMDCLKTLLVLILFSCTLRAQEVGFSAIRMWSDDFQLNNPSGFGIHLSIPVKNIAIQAEYNYGNCERNYSGYISPGFFVLPHDRPVFESIIGKSKIRSYDISLYITDITRLTNPLQLNAGAGIGINNLEGYRKGLISGEEVTFQKTGRIGILLSASVSYKRLFNLPVKLELQFRQKIIPGDGSIITDSENVFSDAISLKQLSFSISYLFR